MESKPNKPMPRRVFLSSPYRGNVILHRSYARKAMLDSIGRGEAPLATHLLYTQVLDDRREQERELGMKLALAWLAPADALVVYTDYAISEGMAREIAVAVNVIPIEYRTIGKLKEEDAICEFSHPQS